MTLTNRLDPVFVRAEIERLRLRHPEIWAEDDATLLADMLEAETGLNEFLTAVVRRMLEDRASIGGIDDLIKDLKARQDRLDQRHEAMRALAFNLMQAAEVKKLELAPATLSIRSGTPKVIITDESALPENCVRIKREPDKIAIRDQLARGDVPGAEMSNSEPVLAVRVK